MTRPKTKAIRPSNGNAAVATKANGVIKSKSSPVNKKVIEAPINYDDPQVQAQGHTLDARALLQVLTEMKNGNFSVRMPSDEVGLNGKVCDTLNEIIALNEKMM